MAPDAPATEDEPDEFLAALAPGEEEWLDERPVPDRPEDPAQPVLGPAPGIAVPEAAGRRPDHRAAAAAPGALATFQRRQSRSEEELRKQLARAPEIGLERRRCQASFGNTRSNRRQGWPTSASPTWSRRRSTTSTPA